MNLVQLKNSIRFLMKKKSYFFINVTGLGVGIAAFLVLFIYVYNDFTYNHFNEKLSDIYRVSEGDAVQTRGLMLPEMLKEIPEVENGTRIFDWESFRLSYGNNAFYEDVQYVDTGFFSVFSFPFIETGTGNDIHSKYNAVVSKEFAEKYFGNESAIGKRLQLGFENIFLEINGVVEVPENSSVKFDIVTSYETGEEISPWIKDVHDWYNVFSTTYVLLKEGTRPEEIYAKMQVIASEKFLTGGTPNPEMSLLPFRDYHGERESNRTLIIILGIIALGILCIAMVNFINLTITNSLSRNKEIGIKKVLGAEKNALVRQIITESLIVSFVAVIIGFLIAVLFLPEFNRLYTTSLSFSFAQNKFLLPFLVAVWLLVGFLSGLAPALLCVKANTIDSLKGKTVRSSRIGTLRYSLVVLQFVIAIILITGTFMVQKQISYLVNHDPKFDKENVVVVELNAWQYEDLNAASQKFKIIANELKSSSLVRFVSFAQCTPGNYTQNYNEFYPASRNNSEKIRLRKAYIGRNYFSTLGINLVSGEEFSDETRNYKQSIVLNSKAMRELGYDDVDDQILNESGSSGTPWKVVGEVDDFAYQGAQYEMQSIAHIFQETENFSDWNYLLLRANENAGLKLIQLLEDKWQSISPESTLTYFFAEEKLNEHYTEYMKTKQIITWFSVVAILLSCIGLFALSSYAIMRRTKEVGIRKVNGARVSEVITLLNMDFLRWVFISFLVATPISWFVLNRWLQDFALKTTLSWWIFALSGFLAFVIALLTVSWKSWRAATRNPVEALRDE